MKQTQINTDAFTWSTLTVESISEITGYFCIIEIVTFLPVTWLDSNQHNVLWSAEDDMRSLTAWGKLDGMVWH